MVTYHRRSPPDKQVQSQRGGLIIALFWKASNSAQLCLILLTCTLPLWEGFFGSTSVISFSRAACCGCTLADDRAGIRLLGASMAVRLSSRAKCRVFTVKAWYHL